MEHPKRIPISDYTYQLPQTQIASFPLATRDASRLLVYRNGLISDDHFYHLPDRLPNDATLVVNNTRVIEARLLFRKSSGGTIEVFCLEPHGQSMDVSLQQKGKVQWQCLIGGASKWKHGQVLQKEISVGERTVQLTAKMEARLADSFVIEFSWEPADLPFAEVLHVAGSIPLPPYMGRNATDEDRERYQTVFSEAEGSVAAPTAALHFTPTLFKALEAKGIRTAAVTLHVGAGTFKPVKAETMDGHHMHSEPFTVSKNLIETVRDSNTIVAVGTTSLRTLESLYWMGVKSYKGLQESRRLDQWEAYELAERFPGITVAQSMNALLQDMEASGSATLQGSTSLIIAPGYRFTIPKGLITNFHQPQSTLLLLVSAFIGEDWRSVYDHALNKGYRFLSYGDSSLLWRTM